MGDVWQGWTLVALGSDVGGLWNKMMNVGRGLTGGFLAFKGAISPEMAVLLLWA